MLSHVFTFEVQKKIDQMFDGCDSLSSFLENLRNLKLSSDHFIEHGFEALIEALIKHEKIINEYSVTSTEDASSYYVHGIGTNSEGHQSAVGVFYVLPKYEDHPLTSKWNHVSQFFDCSQHHYKVACPPEYSSNTLYLFSNGPCLHDNTSKQFVTMQQITPDTRGIKDAVVYYMRDDIAALIDGNDKFWKFFQKEMISPEKPLKVKKLRKFQKNAIDNSKGKKLGKIILPTGTGKTLIEAGLIEEEIKSWKKKKRGKPPVCVICSPRIMLTYQHIDEISKYLLSRKIDVAYICLNSGAYDDRKTIKSMTAQGMEVRNIPSTTCSEALGKKYAECCLQGLPLVIGSTYQSLARLVDIPIVLKIADEAHNLVSGRMPNIAKEGYHDIKSKRAIFCTATPSNTRDEDDPDGGSGMQNTDLFGEVLFTKTPKEMLNIGEIVPPYIHRVEITKAILKSHNVEIEDFDNNPEIDDIVIMESFNELRKTHYKWSSDPEKIGTKLLVTFKGGPQFNHFFSIDNTKVRQWAEKNNVILIGTTDEHGVYIIGAPDYVGEEHLQHTNCDEDFNKYLDENGENKEEKVRQQMIIGHIDKIGEGTNIPTLLGVLPMKGLGVIKSAQNIGRAMRLCASDRKDFYSSKTTMADRKKISEDDEKSKVMVKPFCWVVAPFYTWDQQDSSDHIVRIAQRMKDEYGYNPVEDYRGGENGTGRRVQFTIDSGIAAGEIKELDIEHRIDNPEFERLAADAMEEIRENPASCIRRITKYLLKNNS